jgi:SAM-dependent methyltransferase
MSIMARHSREKVMFKELLPDRLKRLWGQVENGKLSPDRFQQSQDRLLGECRREWEQALLLGGYSDLGESTVYEIGSYLGNPDLDEVRALCSQALRTLKGEWRRKVPVPDRESVESFYDSSGAMLYELMWWHTLIDDLSPLAYVVSLDFAARHGCRSLLDFGSGVGSGGIFFARRGFPASLADISSTALDFSYWRFEKRGLAAHHIDLKKESLPEDAFDFITAMDVFEHLVDPVSTTRELWRALKRGGFLFGRFHSELDEDRPHHIVLDFTATLEELASLGCVKVWRDQWLWGHEVFRKT